MIERKRSSWRWLKRGMLVLAGLLIIALLPVLWVETSCYRKLEAPDQFKAQLPQGDHRAEVNSYLTYPEWSIVHAYQDFAAVSRASSETDFRYLSAITGYWRNLCHIVGYASARGPVSEKYRTMLHIIGVSFSAEMAIKGLYENTIGRLSVWFRGKNKTNEDHFAQMVSDEYADFLHQTPWYEFPFGDKLVQFWRATPFSNKNRFRSLERRISLSLEYGGKAIYARALGALAGTAPAALQIRSIVTGGDPSSIAGVTIIKQRGDGTTVIETPRYAQFTKIIKEFAKAGIRFVEIAGNDDIMVGLLATPRGRAKLDKYSVILSVRVEFRQGWTRHMLSVPINDLTKLVNMSAGENIELEHIYDY